MKLFHACDVNTGIFGPVEDSVHLTVVIETMERLFLITEEKLHPEEEVCLLMQTHPTMLSSSEKRET